MTFNLRDYQKKSVDDIREMFKTRTRVLYYLPTGGGKTYTFCYISHKAAEKGNSVMIVVHRQELLLQASASLAKLGVEHGIIGAASGIKEILDYHGNLGMIRQSAPVQVASVQTLVRRLDTITRPDLLIFDEAHHAVAGSWRLVLNEWIKSKVLGVTATPTRLDGRGLGDVFQGMVKGPSIQTLIAEENLTDCRVFAPREQLDFSALRTQFGDFKKKEAAEFMGRASITGDAISHYRKHANHKPAIGFCVSIKHAEQVANDFNNAGYIAKSIDGKMKKSERAQLIRALGNGEINLLTSCDLISEGTDIPIVSAALMLRPTQSEGLFIQQAGRILRPFPGKGAAILLDHAGNTLRHGHPTLNRDWQLLPSSEKRNRKGPASDEAVRQCPECFAVYTPVPICPSCGALFVKERKLEIVDGDLVEIDSSEWKQARGREVVKAESYDDFVKLEKQRGYKHGWADAKYNQKIGKKSVDITLDEETERATIRGFKNPAGYAYRKHEARQQQRKPTDADRAIERMKFRRMAGQI